jgi:F-type H+-transporting ATPase subunit a
MYHYSWVQFAEGAIHAIEGLGLSHHDAVTMLSSWGVCLFLIAMALLGRRGLNKARGLGGTDQFHADRTFSVRNAWEMYTEAIFSLSRSVLSDKDSRTHFWLIGGLFAYILTCNLLSVMPGGLPPTDNISNNAAMALTVFLVFNVAGVARNGMGYFKHMAGPVWWLMPALFVIELIGVIVRPASLSLRLMGNIFGDHTVFGIMSDLVPLVVPSIFLGLGIFVSFLQAFVFTLLSAIYIALSVAHDDDH